MKLMHPGLLWLFLLYVPLIWWYVKHITRGNATMRVSSTHAYRTTGRPWKEWLMHAMMGVRLAALGCLIIILCRPQGSSSWSQTHTDGVDLMIALDVSSTMLARDLQPDRFTAAKDDAINFVKERKHDNVGLVTFAGEAFTNVPLTNDMGTLVAQIKRVQMGWLDDGTAIGDGVATAINRIKDGKAKSKSIVLLTDGSNNTGIVSPLTAAQIAAQKGIKIYTIGVGTNGMAPMPVAQNWDGSFIYERRKVEMDESTLKKMAHITGGKYFRATDENVLSDVFREIDQLEKSRLNVSQHHMLSDEYQPWAWALLLLLLVDVVARYTVLRTIP